MSNDVLQAADEARRFLRGFAAIEQVATVFEKAGSIIQAIDENEKSLARLQGQVVTAQSTLADLQGEADRVMAKAKDGATAIIDDAKKEALDTRARAKKAADDITAKIQEASDAAEFKVADLTVRADELDTRIKAANAELQDILKRTAEAKAQVAKLLGN